MSSTKAPTRRPWPAPRTSLPASARNQQAWVALAKGCVAALLLPLVAYSVQLLLWRMLAPFAWFLFWPVIFFAPRIGGLWSGLAATLVSIGLVWWRFLPPERALVLADHDAILSVGLFAAVGVSFAFFQERANRLEDASRPQAQRLTAAIEAIPGPFWIIDRDGRLASFNADFRRMLSGVGFEPKVGIEHGQVIEATKALFMPMTEHERAQFLAQRAEMRRTGSDCYDVRLADGRTFRVNTSTMPDGGLVTVAFDRTEELRRARELELARAEAESASDAKSEFLASMSHELRTPLNAVLGFAELLKRSRTEPLTERQRRMVDHVLRGGKQLLGLVDEVLDLARIEAKGVSIIPEAVSLAPVVEEVLATLRPAALAAGVDLGCDCPVNATLGADHARFAQILFNLGSNAIKYNRRGGSVRFAASLSARSVRIAVTDTGLGIPAAKQANLFQPFYRAGQEAGPIAGTGIGLTICKRLAESMHGSVGYQSLPNGSEFWVELPRVA